MSQAAPSVTVADWMPRRHRGGPQAVRKREGAEPLSFSRGLFCPILLRGKPAAPCDSWKSARLLWCGQVVPREAASVYQKSFAARCRSTVERSGSSSLIGWRRGFDAFPKALREKACCCKAGIKIAKSPGPLRALSRSSASSQFVLADTDEVCSGQKWAQKWAKRRLEGK